MKESSVPLVIHAGYPKTATTTFQEDVFPHHPEIEYLGKFIPSFRFRHEDTYLQIEDLLHKSNLQPPGLKPLRRYTEEIREQTARKVVLISSEAFIHPTVIDAATVAKRLKEAFAPCRIWITLREQISMLLSFYWMHGQYGQYLSLAGLAPDEKLSFPLSFSQWISLQKRTPEKNLIGILNYDKVIFYYQKIFGAENVSVLVYETLKQDPSTYATQVSEILGVDPSMTQALVAGKHRHVSKGRTTSWELRDAQLAERPGSDIHATIDELQTEYRSGNGRLMTELGLPLDHFDYSL